MDLTVVVTPPVVATVVLVVRVALPSVLVDVVVPTAAPGVMVVTMALREVKLPPIKTLPSAWRASAPTWPLGLVL